MGRLSELRALFLFGGQPLPNQPRVGLEDSGLVSWIVETLRVGFRIPFDRKPPISERPLYREFFFSGGLEWPSCVKEYPSLLQSKKSASYQTLRMWVAGPHRRTPHLGPLVSSSEGSLHQPERASSSSVQPEGLRTPVGRPVGHSVLRQHHHGSVCSSPAAIHHGLVQYQSGRSQSPHMVIGPEWTLHQDIVDQLVHK